MNRLVVVPRSQVFPVRREGKAVNEAQSLEAADFLARGSIPKIDNIVHSSAGKNPTVEGEGGLEMLSAFLRHGVGQPQKRASRQWVSSLLRGVGLVSLRGHTWISDHEHQQDY